MTAPGCHWTIAAPFFVSDHDQWLSDFVPGDQHHFTTVARPGQHRNWHQRRRRVTPGIHWAQYLVQGRRALRSTRGGVITVLPQLAATVAAQKRAYRLDVPLLSWFFNTELEQRLRVAEARVTLQAVDRFIVHSSREIGLYSDLLHLPAERFSFVPLQYGGAVATEPVDEEHPFVFATGSGYRDYDTFFRAVDKLGYRTLVLAGSRALRGLTPPASVRVLEQIPKAEIHRLVCRARVNVVPMTTGGANSGLITMVEAFRHGRSLVATMRPGVEDYILPGVNALVHEPGDVYGLAQAIEAMWTDQPLREQLDAGALAFGEANCTDEAAGRSLGAHLDALVAGRLSVS